MNDLPNILISARESETDAGLGVVQSLFRNLNAANVRYCIWKSNEHLTASLQGLTDLDVLVDRRRDGDVRRTLAKTGFRPFQAAAFAGYPAIEDHLALDEGTSRIVHLHLHYRLTLGQKHLMGYRLPWEKEVLDSRRRESRYGVYVAAPEAELLLLVVRDALKRQRRTGLAAWIGIPSADKDFAREFAWLAERADPDGVVELGVRLIGPEIARTLRCLLESGARSEDQRSFAAAVRPALHQHRTYGAVSAALRAAIRQAVWALGGLSRKKFHWPVPLRRITPRGGVAVAFLGSDGAGKSSLSADAVSWLGAKIDVVPIYFGSGDGPASLWRLPMQLLRRLLERDGGGASSGSNRVGWRGVLRTVALVPWALSLSLEKRSKHRRMIRARNRGLVVICDRYPQVQTEGFNDGRLLAPLAAYRWRLVRAIAAWEAKPYAAAQTQPPDLVIKLIASPPVALARRPEMSIDEIDRRIDAVRGLSFPAATVVFEIDADRPLEEVVRAVRRLIWDAI